MSGFLNRNWQILLLLPPIFIIGNIFAPVNYLVIPVVFFFFAQRDKYHLLFVLFAILLLFGDSREDIFQFVKPLRALGMVSIFLISLFDIQKDKYRLNRHILFLVPFLFFSLLILFFSPSPSLSASKAVSYFLLFFNGLHLIKKTLHWNGGPLIRDLITWFTLFLIVGLLLIIPFRDVAYFLESGRYRGLMGNPNGLGNLLTVMLPLLVFYFGEAKKTENPPNWKFKAFVITPFIMSLLLCSSRNALLAISTYMIIHIALRVHPVLRYTLLFGVIPLVAIILIFIPIVDILEAAGMNEYFRLSDLESGSGRLFAWEVAWEEIMKNPLWGRGFYFEEYFFKYQMPFHLWVTGHQGGAHNSYIVFLMNTGFIGFIMLFYFLIRLFANMKYKRYLIPFIPAMASSAMFESWLTTSLTSFVFFFLVSMMIYLPDGESRKFQFE